MRNVGLLGNILAFFFLLFVMIENLNWRRDWPVMPYFIVALSLFVLNVWHFYKPFTKE